MRALQMAGRVRVAAVMVPCLATLAQAQQPGRIRGQIEKADGGTLAVKTRDGAMLTVKVDAATRVSALVKATLADKYKDGEKKVEVTPQTASAAADKGDVSELKTGAQIIIFGWEKQSDG